MTCLKPIFLKISASSDADLAAHTRYIDQLFDRKWLLREKGSGTREVFLKHLGLLADALPVFMHFNEFEEVKTLLLSNPEAVTCISRHAVKKELARQELFEVKLHNLTFRRDLFMVYHKNKHHSKLFEGFADFAQKRFLNNS